MPDLALRVQRTGRGGWYLRVLEPGAVTAGDRTEVIERPDGAISVDELNRVLYRERHDTAALQRAETAPGLRPADRTRIRKRLRGADGGEAAETARLFGRT